jgi:putative ABC transport system substrate-binding protein
MRRRDFIVGLGGAAAWPLATRAQQAGKVWRVGYLSAGDEIGTGHLYKSFVQGMEDRGYLQGKNVIFELRYANSRRERILELLKDLVAAHVDVIMSTSQVGAVAAQATWLSTPVVTVIASDPVAEGLVKSMAHPGGNLTGIANMNAELGGKRLQLLRDAAPQIAKVAVILDTTATGNAAQLASIQSAAIAMKIQLLLLEVRRPEDIDKAFASMRAEGADGLLVMENPVNYPHRARFVKLAREAALPAIYGYIEFAQEGGLMAYSANLPALHRHAAVQVDRILKGDKPADLPIEQPNLFELIINLKTAKVLGLEISPTLLVLADGVIE